MDGQGTGAIFSGVFFEKFLVVTHIQTIFWIAVIAGCFYFMKILQNKKVSFSKRMIIGLIVGAVLGLLIQLFAWFPQTGTVWMKETAVWYGLPGRAFISFLRMLVIPLIFTSIVKVILDSSGKEDLPKVARRGIFWLMFTTGIACLIGIILANFFSLGVQTEAVNATATIRQYMNIVDVIINLIPSNVVGAMVGENIVGLVIFAALVGLGANRMEKKVPEAIGVFKKLIEAAFKVVMSIAMSVIKMMPYAVIALLARTIVSNGIPAIIEASSFILAIYVATILMIAVQLFILFLHGINVKTYVKKAIEPWLLAFTSRSSVGTLPLVVTTLEGKMGVNSGTANLIGSLGTTMGMNGCAGFFPAMVAVMVANMVGIPTDLQFYVMLLIVVVIGSVGIAGIPGAATIAATVVLSGMGMAEYFPLIGIVLAVDPIVDMGRTLTNVNGSMTAAVVTDKEFGTMNMQMFNDANITFDSAETSI